MGCAGRWGWGDCDARLPLFPTEFAFPRASTLLSLLGCRMTPELRGCHAIGTEIITESGESAVAIPGWFFSTSQ